MSSVQSLREFISERLTAAAEEIFTEVEKTIVRYEEEIDRQRRLLDLSWKPQTHLHTTDLPQHHTWKEEEVLTDHWLSNQERNSSTDYEEPGLPQIKEQKDPEPSQGKPKSLEMKEEQQTETFMVTPVYKERNHGELEPNGDQWFSLNSSEAENQVQEGSSKTDSGFSRDEELKQNKRSSQTTGHDDSVEYPKVKNTNKRFACLTCGRKFSVKYNLTAHMRIHTGEKPYSCETCGKTFTFRSALDAHVKSHTGESPFSCETCGKSFIYRCTLNAHVRTHTGEKPFSCKTCGKSFTRKCILNVHVLTHSGERPFSCQTCRKSFTRKYTLNTHIKTHTGEKPFFCRTCGKSFILKSNLNRHMKSHVDYKM